MQGNSNYNNEYQFQSFQKGEERGFAFFFQLHYPSLVTFAEHILKDKALAQDVAEECFIKLWQKRAEIQQASTLKGWLYTTAKFACLDQLSSEKSRTQRQHAYAELQCADYPFETEIIRAETYAEVMHALEALPAASQKVFKLFYFEHKSYAEIAEEMGLSKHTIRNHKARGLFLLKKRFLPLFFVLTNYFISFFLRH